jgi:cytosine/adenosine deaminase-related metal-dependent hydrolase
MMPGFVDCHTHVVPYVLAGLRAEHETLDGPVDNDLKERRVKTLNILANDKSASSLFTTYVVSWILH